MKAVCAAAIASVLMAAGPLRADTILVDCDGGGDYMTIGSGIDAAESGDTVLVAPGIYEGPDNRALDPQGKIIRLISVKGPEQTVIDCGHESRAFDFHCGESADVLVQGFTIRNGDADNGGAIRFRYNSGPTISGCVFTNNRAYANGGALFSTVASDPVVLASDFVGNHALARGGALYSESGVTHLEACDFVGNDALYGGAVYLQNDFETYFADCAFTDNVTVGDGGALVDWGSSPELVRCEFHRNVASGEPYVDGGAMKSVNSDGTQLTACVFADNEAYGEVVHGGAVAIYMGSTLFTDCVFSGNAAQGATWASGGGAYCYNEYDNWGPPCELTGCRFEGNLCRGQGGGLSCEQTRAPITDCVFILNEGVVGGGAYLQHYPGDVASCIFAENTATARGGGASCYGTSPSLPPHLSRVTFFGNSSPQGGAISCTGSASPVLDNAVLAFSFEGCALYGDPALCEAQLVCCDVYGNAGGDWVGCIADQAGQNGNLCEDPMFCDPGSGDYSIDAASPCSPSSNPDCGLIGALGIGCESSAVLRTSWGRLKALFGNEVARSRLP
jgi:predicted outer membrane repeat protein